MPELTDLEGGRCYVILGDCETWDEAHACNVEFLTKQQEDEWDGVDAPDGYRSISIEELVRHYLATKG